MHTMINVTRRRSFRLKVWKTLNTIVGVVTILNVSLVGTFVISQPTASAQVPTGTLTVHKLADGDGDGTFETVDPTFFKWFLKDDSDTLYDMGFSLENIIVGGKIISETGPADFQFIGWRFGVPDQVDCTHPFPPIPVSSPFVVVPVTMDHETVITLCNVFDAGFITVKKNVDVNGDGDLNDEEDLIETTDWTWDLDEGNQNFATGSNQPVATGAHTISEDLKPNYHFTSVECTLNNETLEEVEQTANVDVEVGAGDDLVCTFTNTRDAGTLTVNKNFDDNGDSQVDRTNPEGWTWDLVSGQQDNAGGSSLVLPTGAYTVNEDPTAGYASSWSCSNEASGLGTSIPLTLSFNGHNVNCTFTNTRDAGTLVVNKQYDDNADGTVDRTNPAGWTWDITSGSQDNAGGASVGLVTGAYTVTENAETDYTTTWSCSDQTAGNGTTLNATVVKGQTLTCTFANTKKLTTIAVDKQGSATVTAGDNITYTLAWSVNGNTAATNAVVTDAIPANTTFVAADCGTTTGTCTIDSSTSTISWNLGSRNPGESGTVTLTVKSNSPLTNGTVITNTGTFDTDQNDPVSDSVNTTVASLPVLGLTKEASPTTANPLADIAYTVKWIVSGNANATNVVITDPVPTNMTFVSAADGGAHNAATKTITWNLGTKAPGTNGQVAWIGQIAADAPAGQIVNTASVDSAETDPAINASATINVVIPQVLGASTQPDLTITKSVNKQTAKPGQVVTYTIEVTSTGTEDANNVVVTDTLPKDLSFVNASGRTKTWDVGTLRVNETSVLTVDVRVESDAKKGDYVNAATAIADEVEQKLATATLTVVTPKILGLATTGTGLVDYLFFASGLALAGLGVLGLRRRNRYVQLTLQW